MTGSIAREFPERSTAALRGFGRPLDRAMLAGGVAAVLTAVVTSVVARSLWPLAVSILAGAGLGAIIGLAVARLLIPTKLLRAFEAFSWLGRSEMDRFVARTGSEIPVRRGDIERWLAANQPSPPVRLARIELLAFVGRLDEARLELAAVEPAGPGEAFELASLAQYIGWLTDGDPRIAELRAGVAVLPLDAEYRRAADVTIALADARERVMRSDPAWWRPLEEVRPSLGRAAGRVVLRDTWRQMAILYLFIALVTGMLGSLLPGLP